MNDATAKNGNAGSLAVRTITNVLITAWGTGGAGERMGFKVDLPDAGEKSVTNPIALGERMLFTTLIPLDSPCAFGGTGFLMEINIVNGGTLPNPVFDLDGDGVFDDLSDNSNFVAGVNRDIGLVPQPVIIINPPGGGGGGDDDDDDCDKPGYILKVTAGTKGSRIECNPPAGLFASRRSWRQLQ